MRQGCRFPKPLFRSRNIDLPRRVITFLGKGGRIHAAPLHHDLLQLVRRAKKTDAVLISLDCRNTRRQKCGHQFFRRLGLRHLSFHATRVTVVTRLARKGFSMAQTKAYVGHASDTVHAIYQRLSPVDVRHLGAALSSRPAWNRVTPFQPT